MAGGGYESGRERLCFGLISHFSPTDIDLVLIRRAPASQPSVGLSRTTPVACAAEPLRTPIRHWSPSHFCCLPVRLLTRRMRTRKISLTSPSRNLLPDCCKSERRF